MSRHHVPDYYYNKTLELGYFYKIPKPDKGLKGTPANLNFLELDLLVASLFWSSGWYQKKRADQFATSVNSKLVMDWCKIQLNDLYF
ncbi:MAG: hypothetical protein ACPGWR_18100 [Ardenticatenaceae bacterium]